MKTLFGILLAAGLAAIGTGLVLFSSSNRLIGILLAGAGLVTCAAIFIWVPGFMNRREERQRQADIKRAEEIAERIALIGESFSIYQRSSALTLAIFLTMLVIMFFMEAQKGSPIVGLTLSALCAVCAFFAWITALPLLIAPALSFTREGLKTALYGFIPWSEISGLHLSVITSRGAKMYVFELSVPNAPALKAQMHLCGRMRRWLAIGKFRTMFRFALSRTHATFASHLAELLWQRSTGRKNLWIPGDQALTEELRRNYELLDNLNRPEVQADPEKVLKLLEQDRAWRSRRDS